MLGTEVHKVCRIEGVKTDDLLEPIMEKDAFPLEDRILISTQGLEQLHENDRVKFTPAGNFRLKGFDELYALWVYRDLEQK